MFRLQSCRMPGHESARIPPVGVPTRPHIAAPAKIRRIQTQPGYDRKRMSVPRIDGHPSSTPAVAIAHQVARRHGGVQQSRAVQGKGNRSRAIVPAIVKRSVPAAPDVGFSSQGVRGPDRVLHALRRPRWRVRDPIPQNRLVSGYGRPVSPLFDSAIFLLLLLILIILLGPRRGCLCAARRRIRHPNRLHLRFFIRLVNFFRSPGRPRSQSSRRVIRHLYRRDRCRGQNARGMVDDWRGCRVDDRPGEHERLERHRKWGRSAMSHRPCLNFGHEGKCDRDRAAKNGGPASSRGAGCKAHASEISCSRANPIIFSIRCRPFEPPTPTADVHSFSLPISDLRPLIKCPTC